MNGVAFVDTETTGLDPDLHQIWEVGLIFQHSPLYVQNGEWLERRWLLPVDLGRADAVALRISGYHDRRIGANWLTALPTFAEEFAELTRGRHLCGAVVSFDEERLRKLLRANGACPEWHYHLIDVEALAIGYLHGQRKAGRFVALDEYALPWKSDDLSRSVGVDPDQFDRHTALGDARWAKALYEAVST